MVNYLVLYSQNFKITFLRKLDFYSCHLGGSNRVQILFLPFFSCLYPNESKTMSYILFVRKENTKEMSIQSIIYIKYISCRKPLNSEDSKF